MPRERIKKKHLRTMPLPELLQHYSAATIIREIEQLPTEKGKLGRPPDLSQFSNDMALWDAVEQKRVSAAGDRMESVRRACQLVAVDLKKKFHSDFHFSPSTIEKRHREIERILRRSGVVNRLRKEARENPTIPVFHRRQFSSLPRFPPQKNSGT